MLSGKGLRRAPELVSVSAVTDGLKGLLAYVWDQDTQPDSEPPPVIVGQEDVINDLIAWSLAFLRPFSPLSSLVSLYSIEEWDSAASHQRLAHSAIDSSFVGVVFGELLAQASGSLNPGAISFSGAQATLSFSVLRALFGGAGGDEAQFIPNKWSEVRHFFELGPSKIHPESTFEALRTILFGHMGGDRDPNAIGRVCDAFRRDDYEDAVDILRKQLSPAFESFSSITKMSAEERVRAYEHISKGAVGSSNRETAFVLASAAALCRPGTFEVIGLLEPYAKNLPETILWFGVLQGLPQKNSVLTLSDGLGWRLWREIFRSTKLLDRPTCDLSFRELKILARSKSGQPLSKFVRGEVRGRLNIELSHGVTVPVRVAVDSTQQKTSQTSMNRDIFEAELAESEAAAKQKMLIERTERLSQYLHSALNEVYSIRSGDLGPGGSRSGKFKKK